MDGNRRDVEQDISIHAPPRGATVSALVRPCGITNFNSRPSARGDRQAAAARRRPRHISIHAPPRGATSALQRSPSGQLFQFTPLREGRRSTRGLPPCFDNFNSRPSARGDLSRRPRVRASGKFQFTPLREGRRFSVYHADYRGNFNSRPSARGDPAVGGDEAPVHNFNSRPSARGDGGYWCIQAQRGLYFNSRPSARGDGDGFRCSAVVHISIHAPPRGATP